MFGLSSLNQQFKAILESHIRVGHAVIFKTQRFADSIYISHDYKRGTVIWGREGAVYKYIS
jgi:hypothetical protein